MQLKLQNNQHKHKRSPSNVSREKDKRWWQKIPSNKSLKCPQWKMKVAQKKKTNSINYAQIARKKWPTKPQRNL
jgi:hypothetical protein